MINFCTINKKENLLNLRKRQILIDTRTKRDIRILVAGKQKRSFCHFDR